MIQLNPKYKINDIVYVILYSNEDKDDKYTSNFAKIFQAKIVGVHQFIHEILYSICDVDKDLDTCWNEDIPEKYIFNSLTDALMALKTKWKL